MKYINWIHLCVTGELLYNLGTFVPPRMSALINFKFFLYLVHLSRSPALPQDLIQLDLSWFVTQCCEKA